MASAGLKYGWKHDGNSYTSPGGFTTTRTGYRNDVVRREIGYDSEKQRTRLERTAGESGWTGRVVDAVSALRIANFEGRDKDPAFIRIVAELDRAQQAAGRTANKHKGSTGQFKDFRQTPATKEAMRRMLIALGRLDPNDKRVGTDY